MTTYHRAVCRGTQVALLAPECYELDSAVLAKTGNDDMQLDLFLGYASNVAL